MQSFDLFKFVLHQNIFELNFDLIFKANIIVLILYQNYYLIDVKRQISSINKKMVYTSRFERVILEATVVQHHGQQAISNKQYLYQHMYIYIGTNTTNRNIDTNNNNTSA